jgi:hypothetical protein
MTKSSANDGKKAQEAGDFRYFILAVNSGTAVIEKASLSAAEIPLTVLSSLGVSKDTTDSARESTRNLAHGIHGTVDSIAEQIASAVSEQVSLVADVVSSATKDSSK